MTARARGGRALRALVVPAIFLVVCVVLSAMSGLSPSHIVSEIVTRLGRNCVLVLALIVPVVAGLGLNFAIVIGAMAGQAALIMVVAWGMRGLPAVGMAALLALPIALILGWLVGLLFNKARGKEMITGLIAGFFAAAPYQLIFLFSVGSLIPLSNEAMVLPGPADDSGKTTLGVGLRNTIDLVDLQHSLDELGEVEIHIEHDNVVVDDEPIPEWLPQERAATYTAIKLPLGVFAMIGLVCAGIVLLLRTKFGQQLRAMGQNAHVAEVQGIRVSRNRIIATMISIVIAALGQIIWLQNMGNMNTYNAHENVGLFAIGALLVSGASEERATWWQAILGVLLFHSLQIVLPQAGARLFPGHAMLGEYLRDALSYSIITLSLVVYAIQQRRRRTV